MMYHVVPCASYITQVGLPTKSTPGHLIKRVIGMPGDKVVCCDDQNRVTVNGQPLDETSYLYTSPSGKRRG